MPQLFVTYFFFPTMRPEKVESVDAEVKADMEKKNKKN